MKPQKFDKKGSIDIDAKMDDKKEVALSKLDDDHGGGKGGHKLDVDVDQKSVLDDQDVIGVKVIGSQPVKVEVKTKIDQDGKIDQDEKVKADSGGDDLS